jgi:hypothetical protein
VYSPEAMATIFAALFDKIHPLAIGAIEQSYALSKLVARQCLAIHMDPETDGPKIEAIVDRLCDEYKSHMYQLSRSEARKMGLNVVNAEGAVEQAMMNLFRFYFGRPSRPPTPPKTGQQFQAHIAWLDTTGLNFRVEGTYQTEADGKVTATGDQWVSY